MRLNAGFILVFRLSLPVSHGFCLRMSAVNPSNPLVLVKKKPVVVVVVTELKEILCKSQLNSPLQQQLTVNITAACYNAQTCLKNKSNKTETKQKARTPEKAPSFVSFL